MTIRKIMILAGEPSGDLHAAMLACELKKLSPEIKIFGIGGEKMRAAGVNILFDLKDLAFIGLFDVVKNIFRLKKIQKNLLEKAKEEKPDLIILVDYPDFNLRFAEKINNFLPVIYYISPQVWAWRKHRIKLIKKYVKKIYVVFKFEEELYKKENISVEFIGHPLLDIVRTSDGSTSSPPLEPSRAQSRGQRLATSDQTIALLPGSRTKLVKILLPLMLKSAELINKKLPDIKFIISRSPSINGEIYKNILNKFRLPVEIIENKTYDVINSAELVLTVSGTSTLETAILERPMVIIYKLPLLEYLIARPMLLLKNIGLVNIVAGKEIVPEFLQFRARPKNIAAAAIELLTDKSKYQDIKNRLLSVKKSLYPAGAAKRAAISILQQ